MVSGAAGSKLRRWWLRYGFKPGTVVLTNDTVEPALEQELAASGVPGTTVVCPATIAVKESEKVTCTATVSGGRQSE